MPILPDLIHDENGELIGTAYPLPSCSLWVELDGRIRLLSEQAIPLDDLRRLRDTIDELLKRAERGTR